VGHICGMIADNTAERQKQSAITLEQLLDERGVSCVTGRSVASLRRDRLLRTGIPYVKLGSLVRYDPCDIRDYIERNKRRASASGRRDDGGAQ
jgi:hypothetical protein